MNGWYYGTADPDQGIVFQWNNEAAGTVMEKCFASTQYSTERYRPRFEITSQPLPNVIEDGVYRIIGPSLNVVSVDNESVMAGSVIKNLVPQDNMQGSSQYWRIKSTGDGYYTIRPLSCTLSGLCRVGTSLSTQDIGTSDDSTTPASGKWRIVMMNGWYVISPSDDVSLAVGGGGSATTATYNLQIDTLNGSSPDQQWSVTRIPESVYNEKIIVFDRYHNSKVSSGAQLELYAGEVAYMDQMRYAFAIVTEGAITGVYPLSTGTGYLNTIDYGSQSGRSYVHALNPGEDSIIFECYGVSGYIQGRPLLQLLRWFLEDNVMKKISSKLLILFLCFSMIGSLSSLSAEVEDSVEEIPEFMKASNVFMEEQLEVLYASGDYIPFDIEKLHGYKILPIYGMKLSAYYAYWERPLDYYTEDPYLYGYVIFSDKDCFFVTCRKMTIDGREECYFDDGWEWEYSAALGLMPAEYRSIAPQMYLDGAMRNVNNVTVLGNLESGVFSVYYLTDQGTFVKHFERSDPEGVVDQSALFTEEKFRELRSILYTDLRENLDYYAQLSKETGMVYVGGGASPFYQLAEEAGIEIEYAPPGNPIPEHLQPKAEQKTTAPAEQAPRTGWIIGCVAAGVLGIAAMTVPVLLRRTSLKKE